MRPLFTIHAGEFLVGDYISRKLKRHFDVWLPVRDTGVDLLITPKGRRGRSIKPVSLQVKFSRSFSAKFEQPEFLARGWFTLKPAKIMKSEADVWVFVILTLRHEPYFVLVPLKELKRRMPRSRPSIWHLYLTIYNGKKCFDTRGLRRDEVLKAPSNGVKDQSRDYTSCFDNWNLLRGGR